MITLTIDLEDPTGLYEADGRTIMLTRRLLDLFSALERRATFFVVGRMAEAAPDLIKDIAAKGHEIAYHSHGHIPLTEEIPARFRRESMVDKDRLEQLAGAKVTGFRAPQFSLTPKSMWALNILGELGFRYSSSTMPTSISLFGFTHAPHVPFLWPNGLIELPLPVAACGAVRVPYLGGIYLYAMPLVLVRRWIAESDTDEILWTYAHPYDFDREEKFYRMPYTSHWVSFVLWAARQVAEKKVRTLLSFGDAAPLGERIESESWRKNLPHFDGHI